MKTTKKKTYPLTDAIRNEAEQIVKVSPAEAAALPGFLGRLVPVMLAHPGRGWYGCTLAGVKTLFLPKN
jgi:hypothetical protein